MYTQTFKRKTLALVGAVALFFVTMAPAFAESPVIVEADINACAPTIVSASGATISSMYITVDTEDDAEQFALIPTDGSSTTISVGPFPTDTTVFWNVFGGGERDYDLPLWNGYGQPGFSSDIGDYYVDQGNSFSWVIAGTDDPNPFVSWNEFEVPGCSPAVALDCKKGGWEDYGFRNQGQCVRYVETEKDSR